MNVTMNGCDFMCDNVTDCNKPWNLYCYGIDGNCTQDMDSIFNYYQKKFRNIIFLLIN